MKINYTEQRTKYKGMSRNEIVRSMDEIELRRNARKGGKDAIEELTRRESEKARHVTPQPEIDIGV